MKAVELFAGAGGLGMGISLAGFQASAVVEWDRWACDTIRENSKRGYPLTRDWPVTQADVREFDFEALRDKIDLVSGGPPCQPFSMGGKHRGLKDNRDMFPTTVDAIRRLRPKAFIIENVKGLTRAAFANYFQYIVLQLTYPDLRRRGSEEWIAHLARLERAKTSNMRRGLTYEVVYRVLDAANHGVPQKRERVFIVGFRSDLGIKWSFPEQTHNLDAMLEDQWISGDYWERHEISAPLRPAPPDRYAKRIEILKNSNHRPMLNAKPWRTVRDALVGLPEPNGAANDGQFFNHQFQAGARSYVGHTGSPIDYPAKALKAGDHGVPGGENMLVMGDGKVRYFTVREAARIQTFPDGYVFHGSWSETMRQLGNAVPVRLAHVVAASVGEKLARHDEMELKRIAKRLARG
ncbi:MAG: DNA cytosine methyltransferase [Alphaproteobacteria bacterium]